MDQWLALIKSLLGIPAEDTSKDELIEFYISIALDAIQARTGRSFLHGIYLDTLHGPHQRIYTTELPIIEVIEVKAGGGLVDPSQYRVDMAKGYISFYRECRCYQWFYDSCCLEPLSVQYEANTAMPPNWLTLAVTDAVRAALASQDSVNVGGFMARKVAVTDVGSVEYGNVGDSPGQSLTTIIDGSLEGWIPPTVAFSYSCCNGSQTSELIEDLTNARRLSARTA